MLVGVGVVLVLDGVDWWWLILVMLSAGGMMNDDGVDGVDGFDGSHCLLCTCVV